MNILSGVYEYLNQRHPSVRMYHSYIEVVKRQHTVQLTISDGMCVVTVFKTKNKPSTGFGLLITDRQFDLSNPNSLQAIYEYVSSKGWR